MKSNRHEAHYRIFHIPLFLTPSHIKYSPHHPAINNPQSVFFSWCKRPNFTLIRNNQNNVSQRTRNIPHWMIANTAWTWCFYRPKNMFLLTFCQDLTCLKPDLQQSGIGTSWTMCNKIQIAPDMTIRTVQNLLEYVAALFMFKFITVMIYNCH